MSHIRQGYYELVYRYTCLLQVMMEDYKCTWECACVDGCSMVGTDCSSCECALHHGACDCGGMHVSHAGN